MQLDLASILDGSITGVLFGAIYMYFKGTLIKNFTYGETQYNTGISYLATEMTKTVFKITKLFLQCMISHFPSYLNNCKQSENYQNHQ